MKILLLNTYDNFGGASVACVRLLEALRKNETIEAKLLVQNKKTNHAAIESLAKTYLAEKKVFWRFAYERFTFFLQEKDKTTRFAFSPANIGTRLHQHPLVKEADVLHLHWVNFGFLSLKSLRQLVTLQKPIVWTLHDMWAFTGGCHYSSGCRNFEQQCGNCHFLKNPQKQDWSYQILQQKLKIFDKADLHIVACSQWLADEARKSTLFAQKPIITIPNPIDTKFFDIKNKKEIRQQLGLSTEKLYVLFGAMNVQDNRKGFVYLQNALQFLQKKYSSETQNVEILIFGKNNQALEHLLPYPVRSLGSISDKLKLVAVYNAANVFVLPSLEDNLPNTVMEALACGTPVVAFRNGGLPDMIEHLQSGYLAHYQSAEDLAEGIYFLLSNPEKTKITQNARQKVLREFNEQKIAQQYIALYRQIR